jgi:uncharacterized protein YjbI with pentapeptide repeats
MADAKIDPFDVGALERSVNDSAGRVSGIWLSFVAFSAYLAAAASMITHRQIFLEEPIKLPTINIDLPLVASAILLPLLFVIYHVYVLLQVVLLARTADAYNEAIEHNVTDEPDRIRIRQRLANTLFAQLFAGSSREREGVLGWLLRLMAWITLAIAPVGVLLTFEIKFLPYHSAAVTWTHRGLIAFDLLAVLLLWAGAVRPRWDIGWKSLIGLRTIVGGAVAIFVLSNLLITLPGEPGRLWMKFVSLSDKSSGDMPECGVAKAVDALVAPGFDRLVLLGEDFVDDDKLAKIISTAKTNEQKLYDSERTRIFRNRDFRCARLAGADLRHADFGESDLSGAVLRGAHLEGARFAGAILAGAILDNAQLQDSSFGAREVMEKQLDEAKLPNSSLRGAQLQRAYLNGANLAGADLSGAQLEEASLEGADLRGASLNNARLRDARLDVARLQGASFKAASMSGASFNQAAMQGVSLAGARMLGASFDGAIMHGASFHNAQLHGATFERTQLHGAQFRDAVFAGAAFIEAQMQGVQIETGRSGFRQAVVADSFLWRAGRVQCDLSHVLNPSFESIIDVSYQRGKPVPVGASDRTIADFIDRSLADVPERSRVVADFSKEKLRTVLNDRLRTATTGVEAAQIWESCAHKSAARTEEDFQKLVSPMVIIACQLLADPNAFVQGLANGWNRGGSLQDVPVAKLFAKALTDENQRERCPRANNLNSKSKEVLQNVANPRGE